MGSITDDTDAKIVAARLDGHEELCRERQKNIDLRFDRMERRISILSVVVGLLVVTNFFDVDLTTAIELLGLGR
ncbi:MAG: hypothetical protein MPL62_00825 [Alphaproteobacteria bacterium]|nr:hypothetical protein [Alphaproteobacteria bacterium]